MELFAHFDESARLEQIVRQQLERLDPNMGRQVCPSFGSLKFWMGGLSSTTMSSCAPTKSSGR
jgi:hypothetical protein